MAHNLTLRKVFNPLKSRLIQKSISEAHIQLPEGGLPELVTVNELRHRGLGLERSQTSFENELPSTSFSAPHPRRTLEGSAEVFSTLNLRGNMGPTGERMQEATPVSHKPSSWPVVDRRWGQRTRGCAAAITDASQVERPSVGAPYVRANQSGQ